eukprot:TRINITY_DN4118_c0_g1_i1.p1 TRINITY_DN4118_c0_g1~~TRINITY_DN4118_c0_g1_i1.p1  ORF type:complete len:350 (+),score=104.61 TRINITY_DN4118_c0_g1_i1:82-1131(+)
MASRYGKLGLAIYPCLFHFDGAVRRDTDMEGEDMGADASLERRQSSSGQLELREVKAHATLVDTSMFWKKGKPTKCTVKVAYTECKFESLTPACCEEQQAKVCYDFKDVTTSWKSPLCDKFKGRAADMSKCSSKGDKAATASNTKTATCLRDTTSYEKTISLVTLPPSTQDPLQTTPGTPANPSGTQTGTAQQEDEDKDKQKKKDKDKKKKDKDKKKKDKDKEEEDEDKEDKDKKKKDKDKEDEDEDKEDKDKKKKDKDKEEDKKKKDMRTRMRKTRTKKTTTMTKKATTTTTMTKKATTTTTMTKKATTTMMMTMMMMTKSETTIEIAMNSPTTSRSLVLARLELGCF